MHDDLAADEYGYHIHTFDDQFENGYGEGTWHSIVEWLDNDESMRVKLEGMLDLPLDESSFEKIEQFTSHSATYERGDEVVDRPIHTLIMWEMTNSGLLYFGSSDWCNNIDTAAWMDAGDETHKQ